MKNPTFIIPLQKLKGFSKTGHVKQKLCYDPFNYDFFLILISPSTYKKLEQRNKNT